MIWSENINDVRAEGEAVGQVMAETFRREPGLLEACRGLPGGPGDGSDVEHGVEIPGCPSGRDAVLGLQDPDHQASDEDPGQSVQQPGHFTRQAPEGSFFVADRCDPDQLVHALTPSRSLSPTCWARGSGSSSRSSAIAGIGATLAGGHVQPNDGTTRRVTLASLLGRR